MFYIEKTAVYGHGTYWIGLSKAEGISKVDDFARRDSDSHHSWTLREYAELQDSFDVDDSIEHKIIYSRSKDRVFVCT